mgnify:CR=1 FL=1
MSERSPRGHPPAGEFSLPTFEQFRLPDAGEGLTEAEIVTWRVAEGDVVAINDVVVEIETAKSIVELPSPYAGEVLALLVPEGQTVEVGTPIIRIGKPGAAVPDRAPIPASVPPASEVPIAPGQLDASESSGPSRSSGPEVIDTNVPPEGPDGSATLVGYGPRQRALKRRPRKGEPMDQARGGHAMGAVPTPEAPYDSLPGFCLAFSTSSATDRTGDCEKVLSRSIHAAREAWMSLDTLVRGDS